MWNSIFCQLILLALADASSWTRRMANGQDAEHGMFPFVLLIKTSGVNYIGCIVHRRYFITPSGVLDKSNVKKAEIIAGTNDIDGTNGYRLEADDVIDYPEHKALSLVQLSKNIILNPLVYPVSLSSDLAPCVGCTGMLVSWARESSNKSRKLQMGSVSITDMEYCMRWSKVRDHPERYMCTETGQRPHACCGDYGAPLVANGELIGIIYFSIRDKTPGFPDVYFKISYYKPWILETIRKLESE